MKVLNLLVLVASFSGFVASANAECLQSNALVDSTSNKIDKQDRSVCVENGLFKITKQNGEIEFQDKIKFGPADGFSQAMVTENYSIMLNLSATRGADGNRGNILIMGGGPGVTKAYFIK